MNTNLTTIKTIYEAFSKGDVQTILNEMDDAVQWEAWADNAAQKAGVPWLQARSGNAGVLSFFQYLGTKTKLLNFQILGLMEGQNQVAVEFIIEIEMLEFGTRYRDEEIHLWTFNDAGKVIRLRHYTDTAKHMAAAKMST